MGCRRQLSGAKRCLSRRRYLVANELRRGQRKRKHPRTKTHLVVRFHQQPVVCSIGLMLTKMAKSVAPSCPRAPCAISLTCLSNNTNWTRQKPTRERSWTRSLLDRRRLLRVRVRREAASRRVVQVVDQGDRVVCDRSSPPRHINLCFCAWTGRAVRWFGSASLARKYRTKDITIPVASRHRLQLPTA